MNIFVAILHILACVLVIVLVLLQPGKGSDIGSAFGGGGSNTVLGARGASTFISKLTIGAMLFALATTIYLGRSMVKKHESVIDKVEAPQAGKISSVPATLPMTLPVETSPVILQAPETESQPF